MAVTRPSTFPTTSNRNKGNVSVLHQATHMIERDPLYSEPIMSESESRPLYPANTADKRPSDREALVYMYRAVSRIFTDQGVNEDGVSVLRFLEETIEGRDCSIEDYQAFVMNLARVYHQQHKMLHEPTFVRPEEIDDLFTKVTEQLYEGDIGPKPIRIWRVREGFRGRENEYVSLNEFEKQFADNAHPRKGASNTLSWLNGIFHQQRVGWEIHSLARDNTKYYRLRRSTPVTAPQSP